MTLKRRRGLFFLLAFEILNADRNLTTWRLSLILSVQNEWLSCLRLIIFLIGGRQRKSLFDRGSIIARNLGVWSHRNIACDTIWWFLCLGLLQLLKNWAAVLIGPRRLKGGKFGFGCCLRVAFLVQFSEGRKRIWLFCVFRIYQISNSCLVKCKFPASFWSCVFPWP